MTPRLYGRMTTWTFKPGKRAEAVKLVDESLEEIRDAKGFRGLLTLLSSDDKDVAMFLAIWDSEEDLVASQKGIYAKVASKAKPLAVGAPDLRNVEIPRALLALI